MNTYKLRLKVICCSVALSALPFSASASTDRVPPPGCYDYHRCGVDEMSDWEYEVEWHGYGYSTPPDDYRNNGDGSVSVRYGTTVITSTSTPPSDDDEQEPLYDFDIDEPQEQGLTFTYVSGLMEVP